MRALIITGILSIMIMGSCRHKDRSFKEIIGNGLTIQVEQLKNVENDSTGITYKARLIPDKQIMEGKTQQEKTALYYRMDSCFYIADGNKKVYASMVQPIANGVAGSYEYLLGFELNSQERKDSIDMIYQDKYINRQTYRLKLARQ